MGLNDNTIPGYRPVGDRPKDRQLSMGYLQQSAESARLLTVLNNTPGKNCEGREDEFAGDDLPTDREAELMCSTCLAWNACNRYAESAHPAWGVFSGKVYGRNLEAAMKEDNNGE